MYHCFLNFFLYVGESKEITLKDYQVLLFFFAPILPFLRKMYKKKTKKNTFVISLSSFDSLPIYRKKRNSIWHNNNKQCYSLKLLFFKCFIILNCFIQTNLPPSNYILIWWLLFVVPGISPHIFFVYFFSTSFIESSLLEWIGGVQIKKEKYEEGTFTYMHILKTNIYM